MAPRSSLLAPGAVPCAVAPVVALTLVLAAGCSVPQPAEPAHDGPTDVAAWILWAELTSSATHPQASGRAAYYLVPTARGLELTSLADLLDTPSVLAFYGTCDPGEEGGCTQPAMVFTAHVHANPAGFDCRPLEPRLSAPTLLVRGEVHLSAGRQGVRVLTAWTATLQPAIVPTTRGPWCSSSGPWALPGPHTLSPHPSQRTRRGLRRPAHSRAHQEAAQ